MAFRAVYQLLISLLLYEHASGAYCPNDVNSTQSIQFCQSGTISGLKLYINGSSVQTKEDLKDRECDCYVEQSGNAQILVYAGGSCNYCGLQVEIEGAYFRAAGASAGWISLQSNGTKIKMTMGLDVKIPFVNTAFCIEILENFPLPTVALTLTCEDIAINSSATISKSLSAITATQYIITDTTKSQASKSTETVISQAKVQSTNTAEISAGNTNVTHGHMANITGESNGSGKSTFQTENREIIIAAASSGTGVGIAILFTVIIFIFYKRRKKKKQRQSTVPPLVYTELQFRSGEGQSNDHVYNSIEINHTYDKDIQFFQQLN